MNQRSMNLAWEVAEKTTDDGERARMEMLLDQYELSPPPLARVEEAQA